MLIEWEVVDYHHRPYFSSPNFQVRDDLRLIAGREPRLVFVPVLARSNAPLGTTENDPPTYSKESLLAHFHEVFDDRFGDPVVLTGQGDLRGRFVECPYVVYTLTRPATPVGHKPKRIHLEADAVLNSAIDQLDRAGFEDAAAYLRSRS